MSLQRERREDGVEVVRLDRPAQRNALDTALAAPGTRTADLGGALGTAAFTETLTRLIEDAET